jgi:short-subunit dehydrogenase involved in D-alanine esterification of teichoic acids
MSNQSERIVLITGGSSGIGFEMAKQMVAQQSTVIICGRSQEKLDNAKNKVPQLVTIQCDITKAEDREALYSTISERFSGLNMLMNNAGIVKRFLFAKTEDLEEKIVKEWQTNYLAPVMLTKQFLPMLIENKGTVVNVTSGLAYVPLSIEPNYCATKAALHSVTQSMRVQFSKLGVKVVEIFYPAVDTPFQNGHAPDDAIKPDEAAAIALEGLNRGKDEIRVKRAGLLFITSRLMPTRALNLLNGRIPDNVEELLAEG